MRKLLVAAMAVVSFVAYRRWKAAETEKSVWKESTDRLD